MSPKDRRELLGAVCEALYHLRSIGTKVALAAAKTHLPWARMALEDAVRRHIDLGDGAAAADYAKMLLSGHPRSALGAYDAAARQEPASPDQAETALRRVTRARKLISQCLGEAAEADNSLSVFKNLGRFAQFCDRARYAGEFTDATGVQHCGLIPDDPVLPVVSWLQARGCYPLDEDVGAAAELYAQWSREASEDTFGKISAIVPMNPGRQATEALVRSACEAPTLQERREALRALLRACWGSSFAMLDARESLEQLGPAA